MNKRKWRRMKETKYFLILGKIVAINYEKAMELIGKA